MPKLGDTAVAFPEARRLKFYPVPPSGGRQGIPHVDGRSRASVRHTYQHRGALDMAPVLLYGACIPLVSYTQ